VPIDALAHTAGLPIKALSVSIAQLLFFFIAAAPLWTVLFLEKASWRHMLWPALIVGVIYALSQYLTVYFLGVELVNIVGGLAAMGATMVLVRFQRRCASGAGSSRTDLTYLVPFAVMILLVLLTRLVPPLKAVLTKNPLAPRLHFRAGGNLVEEVTFSYLYSAGTMAVASALISIAILRLDASTLAPILTQTLGQIGPMAVAVSSFAAMANVMKDFGMNTAMAQAMVDMAGRSFPLISPLVGMLGTAITGSTAASNMFFGGLQTEVARRLGLSQVAVGASQVVGCTAGEMICPFNALVIASGLGLEGQEGSVMRRMVPSVLVYVSLTMLGSLLFTRHLAR
jgi:lactate permease